MNIVVKLIIVMGLVLASGLNVAIGDRGNHGDRRGDRDSHRSQYYENSGTFLQSAPDYDSNDQIDTPKEPEAWKGRVWYFPDRWCEVVWPNGYVCHYY